ncbi:hypothetical protein BC828DRAFT_389624 [Blastocladiella britannica]|nr:hypothetical protein BC828DRAFT_389624 [Blastocladiella britannica]
MASSSGAASAARLTRGSSAHLSRPMRPPPPTPASATAPHPPNTRTHSAVSMSATPRAGRSGAHLPLPSPPYPDNAIPEYSDPFADPMSGDANAIGNSTSDGDGNMHSPGLSPILSYQVEHEHPGGSHGGGSGSGRNAPPMLQVSIPSSTMHHQQHTRQLRSATVSSTATSMAPAVTVTSPGSARPAPPPRSPRAVAAPPSLSKQPSTATVPAAADAPTVSISSSLRESQTRRTAAKLAREKQQLLDHIAQSGAAHASLSALLSQAHSQNDSLAAAADDREVHLAHLERKLEKRDREVAGLVVRVRVLAEELGKYKRGAADAQQEKSETRAMLDSAAAAAMALQQDLASWRHHAESYAQATAQARAELAARDTAARASDARADDLEQRCAVRDAALAVAAARTRDMAAAWAALPAILEPLLLQLQLTSDSNNSELKEDKEIVHAWTAPPTLLAVRESVPAGATSIATELEAAHTVAASVANWLADAVTSVAARLATVQEQAHGAHAATADAVSTAQQLARTTAERDALAAEVAAARSRLADTVAAHAHDRAALEADVSAALAAATTAAAERDIVAADRASLSSKLTDAESAGARAAADLAAAKRLLDAERRARRDNAAMAADLADARAACAQLTADRESDARVLADEQARRKTDTAHWMQAVADAQRELAAAKEMAASLAAEKRALELELAMRAGPDAVAAATAGLAHSSAAGRSASPFAVSMPPPLTAGVPLPGSPFAHSLSKLPATSSSPPPPPVALGASMANGTPQFPGDQLHYSQSESLSSTIARLQMKLQQRANHNNGSGAAAGI